MTKKPVSIVLEPFGLAETLEPGKEFLVHAVPDPETPVIMIDEGAILVWNGDVLVMDGEIKFDFRGSI
jgi:hypothetical protein